MYRSVVGSLSVLRAPVALALVLSCTENGIKDPVTPGGVNTSSAPSTAVFVVEPSLILTPTYDGSGQTVHPDIVAFDEPWHGARYWLTMTPYPKSDQRLENPSILASDDGLAMRVPAGLTNPVIGAPRNSSDYNSDPELLYEPRTDRLVLFDRLVEKRINTLQVATSRDGVTWTRQPTPFWERSHHVVSPTVAPRSDMPARLWYVNAGRRGCDARTTAVMTRTSSDSQGGIVDTRWLGPHTYGFEHPWIHDLAYQSTLDPREIRVLDADLRIPGGERGLSCRRSFLCAQRRRCTLDDVREPGPATRGSEVDRGRRVSQHLPVRCRVGRVAHVDFRPR